MSPFYPVHAGERHQRLVRADNSPLHYLEIDRLTLAPAEEWAGRLVEREAFVVPLAGSAVLRAAVDGREWELPLRRDDVFAAAPWAAYLPRDTSITLRSRGALEAIIVSAPAAGPAHPAPVSPQTVTVSSVGTQNWQRQVRILLAPEGPATRLIVGETVNPPGHWSGMPPHKHDEATADEGVLEEIYYYRLSPPGGYLIQLCYDRTGWQESQVVSGEGAVAITRGYHPTVAAPGTTGYYLWAVAGAEKAYRVSIDPAFSWMIGAAGTAAGRPV